MPVRSKVRGGPVTTATDVYALGLLLYELLAGVTPYDADTLSASALERAVCDVMPTRPSMPRSAVGMQRWQGAPARADSTRAAPTR